MLLYCYREREGSSMNQELSKRLLLGTSSFAKLRAVG